MSKENNLNEVEHIKLKSKNLRGTIKEALVEETTGGLPKDDQSLIKFYGMYQQDDKDRRATRESKKLENAYSFMLRLRLPGGLITNNQWLATNDIAGKYSTNVIKITTRQTLQLHGILKHQIKPTLQAFNKIALDSIAACGDVNRNVVASAHPSASTLHNQIHQYAFKISELLLPKTKAYFELFIDNELIFSNEGEKDNLYQNRYLPRKFKITIAIPPHNDVDVLANDIGLIAIVKNKTLLGFNVYAGGGLSYTYGNEKTYSRIATPMGFVEEKNILNVIYEIVTTQRDFGFRGDRKLARLKYTIDNMGEDNFKKEVEKRANIHFLPLKNFEFFQRNDVLGWHQCDKNLWHYTLFVENGLIKDSENFFLKKALYELSQQFNFNFRFTCNQNLILSDIKNEDKNLIEKILYAYQIITQQKQQSATKQGAIACVALPTCPLAMAEGQRYLPTLISKMEELFKTINFNPQQLITRMTGCPNGCGRPYLAEIGFTGAATNQYHLYFGGDTIGFRMNKLFKKNLNEAQILEEIKNAVLLYQKNKLPNESFGDFTFRTFNFL